MGHAGELAATTRDRPRERLLACGPHALADRELLALILGSGTRHHSVYAVAQQVVEMAGGIAPLSRATAREVSLVAGIGAARATRIVAAFELGRRAVERTHERDIIGRPEDVYRAVATRFANLAQEVFVVIGLDVRNGVVDVVECARGSVASVEVHPREVFRPLIRMAAAGGVLAHNHPSGDPTPSHDDIELTRRMRAAGRVIGIPIIDHVVIGGQAFHSIAEWCGADL